MWMVVTIAGMLVIVCFVRMIVWRWVAFIHSERS
jgi:hypothetical protein